MSTSIDPPVRKHLALDPRAALLCFALAMVTAMFAMSILLIWSGVSDWMRWRSDAEAGRTVALAIDASKSFEEVSRRPFVASGNTYSLVDFEGRTYSCEFSPSTGKVDICVMIGSRP